MYEFSEVLPFLPMDYLNKVTFSICQSHEIMRQAREEYSDADFMQVHHLYSDLKRYELMQCELLGFTNTRIDPIETGTYPPPLIGG